MRDGAVQVDGLRPSSETTMLKRNYKSELTSLRLSQGTTQSMTRSSKYSQLCLIIVLAGLWRFAADVSDVQC